MENKPLSNQAEQFIIDAIKSDNMDSKIVQNIVQAVVGRYVDEFIDEQVKHNLAKLLDALLDKPIKANDKEYSSLKRYVDELYYERIESLNLKKIIKDHVAERMHDEMVGW